MEEESKENLLVPNLIARNYKVNKIIYSIDSELLKNLNIDTKAPKPIHICSGGTTSNCSGNNKIVIDLRKNFNYINHDIKNNQVTIGGGINMKNLLDELSKYKKTFPIGLSNLPGVGYILTGGVSPLTRKYGLGIDQVKKIKGFLGTGETFNISKKHLKSKFEKDLWKSIYMGASPFLCIATEIVLNTVNQNRIHSIIGFVEKKDLEKLIKIAENFPKTSSLQWFWKERIQILILTEIISENQINMINKLINHLNILNKQENIYTSLNELRISDNKKTHNSNNDNFSEVFSFLGQNQGENTNDFIEIIDEFLKIIPNKRCYLACQQLGNSDTDVLDIKDISIYKKAQWKIWINIEWNQTNQIERELCIKWLNDLWNNLEIFFPDVHLAQIHPQYKCHKKELNFAFRNNLKFLNRMKDVCDPNGVLTSL